MGSSYEPHSNGYAIETNLQIIRHPSYQTSPRFSLPWFDVRVFYVRISNFLVDENAPESLTLNHIPLSPQTILEVNGVRCSADSEEGLTSVLRRDRVDKKSEEATYVGTDSIRLTDSAKFEVFDKNDLVISGVLEMSNANGSVGGESYSNSNVSKWWSMNCEATISAGMGFLKGKQIEGSSDQSLLPNIEVYVAGRFSGTPIILTRNLQISPRKKAIRKGLLDSIPECDGSESNGDLSSSQDLQAAEYRSYKPQNSYEEEEEDYDSLYWRQREYIEGEDGELSWFNAGVRVGVGIGLGICVGVGIGVGLLARTYQTAARTFKRRLM